MEPQRYFFSSNFKGVGPGFSPQAGGMEILVAADGTRLRQVPTHDNENNDLERVRAVAKWAPASFFSPPEARCGLGGSSCSSSD